MTTPIKKEAPWLKEERRTVLERVLLWSQRTRKRYDQLTKKDIREALNSRVG